MILQRQRYHISVIILQFFRRCKGGWFGSGKRASPPVAQWRSRALDRALAISWRCVVHIVFRNQGGNENEGFAWSCRNLVSRNMGAQNEEEA